MWNVRMRASKKCRAAPAQRSGSITSLQTEIHISGAEGIYKGPDIGKIVQEYTSRALNHSRGIPDTVVISLEKIHQKPGEISALPVATLKIISRSGAERSVEKILSSLGISDAAVEASMKVVYGDRVMRGASLIRAGSGRRAEPDKGRGIRVSRLGILGAAKRSLTLRLAKEGINTTTVQEAILLASKVASCRQVKAELCVSDDPDYTTGYISAREYGYVRIPHIKKKGSPKGGRVFFIQEDADRDAIIKYLEQIPVIITRVSGCRGTCSLDDIIHLP